MHAVFSTAAGSVHSLVMPIWAGLMISPDSRVSGSEYNKIPHVEM